MPRKKTKEEFVEDARKIWGDQYDYSQADYVNNKTKVVIRCTKHSTVFEQRPFDHIVMKYPGCPHCHNEIVEQARKRRSTGTEEFVRRAKKKFGDSFDYSQVEYVNSNTPVKIVCVRGGHGMFKMAPDKHLISKHGCRKCGLEATAKSQRMSKDMFLERAQQKFGFKFDYSQMRYTDYNSPVTIICKEHGKLEITPFLHLLYPSGGCKECRKEIQSTSVRKMTTEQFVKDAISLHGVKYDYSNAKYTSYGRPVSLRCLRHNLVFDVSPESHLKGKGCPLCEQEEIAMYEEGKNEAIQRRCDYRKIQEEKRKRSKEIIQGRPSKNYTWDVFVGTAKLIHDDDYDYRFVEKEFVNTLTPVTIICKRHGAFLQKPRKHLMGQGCPRCIGRLRTTESFIEEAEEVHKGHYNYDKVKFVNYATPVTITCKIHGDFNMRPLKHLRGEGCPLCQTSKMELEIVAFLQSHLSTPMELQKHFEWLRIKQRLALDVYLPEYKIAIECQGEQHFVARPVFGGMEALKQQQERDRIKNELCKQHGIQILYYTRNGNHIPNEYDLGTIFTSKKKLLEDILKYPKEAVWNI